MIAILTLPFLFRRIRTSLQAAFSLIKEVFFPLSGGHSQAGSSLRAFHGRPPPAVPVRRGAVAHSASGRRDWTDRRSR